MLHSQEAPARSETLTYRATADSGEQPAPQGPARVAALLGILWEERRYLGHGAAMGLLAGLALAFLVPARYRAEVRFVPEQGGVLAKSTLAGLAATRELPGNSVSELAGIATAGGYFVALARSHSIENRIVDRFELRRVYRERFRETARRVLEKNTDVAEDRRSGIITVTVLDGDRQRAAGIAEAYVEELNRRSSELNVGAAHRERVFIEGRLREVQADLLAAEQALSRFSSSHVTLDLQEQGKAMLTSAATVQGQLIAAESELQGLKQVYGTQNSRVLAAAAKAAEYRRQLARLENEGGNDALELPSLRQLPLIGQQYAGLQRQAKVQQAVYDLLTHQDELAKIEEARETVSVRLVDPAEVPERRAFPPRTWIVILATAFASMASVSYRLLRRAWRARADADPYKLLAKEVERSLRRELRASVWRRRLRLLRPRERTS